MACAFVLFMIQIKKLIPHRALNPASSLDAVYVGLVAAAIESNFT